MPAVHNALIVGGGIAGNALAVLLSRAGVDVHLVEIDPGWSVIGSGITLQGNALFVLREVGVWDEVRARGYTFDVVGFRAPDGRLVGTAPDIRTGGPDLPGAVGMERPKLQEVLVAAVRGSGVRVDLGLTVDSVRQDVGGADVLFSDASAARYDLVVGADGVGSRIRRMIGIEDRPVPVGMGIWRVRTTRPPAVEHTELTFGGPCHLAGYCPTGPDTMYAYVVEDARDRETIDRAEMPAHLRELIAGYGGVWDEIRRSVTDPARINYTWYERLLVDRPWNRGRVVLIGDAAHVCPPSVAQGAAMSLEDALVLAELVSARTELDQGLFDEFMDRRFERARMVVENSVRISCLAADPEPGADIAAMIEKTLTALAVPP